jgi:solute carrier family 50 protein (sugar transporter)
LKQSIIVALDDQSRSFMMEQAEPTKIPTRDLPHPSSTTTLDYANIIWDVAAQKTKAPMAHKVLVLVMVVVWTAVCSFLGFGTHVSSDTRTMVVGVVVNVNLVFFYAAPLSTIADVLKTRSCATIHVPTMLTNTLNGVFWCVFGLAVLDWFIAVPNGIGACLGFIQIVLILIYPQSRLGKEPMDTEAIRDPTIVDRSREER